MKQVTDTVPQNKRPIILTILCLLGFMGVPIVIGGVLIPTTRMMFTQQYGDSFVDSANAMEHHLSQLTRTGSAPPLGADIYSDRGALRETIERKASKKYQISGRPVALPIYIDGVFHPPQMPSSWAPTILGEEGPKRHWAGIWLYDAVYDRIIANWLRE